MENQINALCREKYLFSDELRVALLNGKFLNRESQYIEKYKQGVYLVFIQSLNKQDKSLAYNYICYDKEFMDCLLWYFAFRHIYNNIYTKEWGKYFVLIGSESGFDDPYVFNRQPTVVRMLSKDYAADYATDFNALDFINCLMFASNYEKMAHLTHLSFNKSYSEFFDSVLTGLPIYSKSGVVIDPNFKYNLLNHNLFLIDNLQLFISNIKNSGFKINQGLKKWRGQVSGNSNKLSCLDLDFRNSLFNHNQWHSSSHPYISRDKFSFNNIHMNLGSVRCFSSRAVNKAKTRQQLFQENYSIIENKLNTNSNVGGVEIQKDIETLLWNQENLYTENTISAIKLKFNESTYDFIVEKELEIAKILANPDRSKIVSHAQSAEYIPYVELFVKTLTPKLVSKLLIGYFLRILTNEFITIKDVVMPGIPALSAYDYFGGLVKNKYMYVQFLAWKNSNKDNKDVTYSMYKQLNNLKFKDFFIDNFNARVGGYFVFCLWEVKLLYQDLDTFQGLDAFLEFEPKTQYYYRVREDVRKKMLKDNQKVFHLPMKLPMICEPKEYLYNGKNLKLGGYLLNDVCYTDGIFKKKVGYGIETELKENNIIISLINRMSKTPYKINIDTLNFIYEYGFEKNILLDDSSKKFQKFLENPYKGFNKTESKIFRSLQSKLILERNILSIADVYSKVDRIYFPVRLDNRTRIYCETDYFDYQKNDLAKGLISFARPGIITKFDCEAIKYFKAYGGNMYGSGLDKKSLNYRVDWVDNNTDKILDFQYNDIVSKAENKVCFVSFCFEYKRFIEFINNKDSTVFYTYLPIQLDASCNGYQHLVLLTKEIKLLDKLNLSISTHYDDPDDFYSYILEKTYTYIKSQIVLLKTNIAKSKHDKDDKEKNLAEKLANTLDSYIKLTNAKFDRSIVKKCIMTKSYNAGLPRQAQSIIENLDVHTEELNVKCKYYTYKDFAVKLNKSDIMCFVKCIKIVLDIESPKIKELSKYLSEIVGICTKLSIAVPWTLPSGARILESYEVMEKSDIKAFTFIKSKYTFKKYLKGVYDLDKQRRATMPNLIHSLDGSTIAILYNNFNEDLYTIHDCFAVTANHVPFLINKLKMVYRNLYSSESYLKEFDQFVRVSINKMRGDKTFVLDGEYVYLPGKDKPIPFPDVNKILSLNSESNKIQDLEKSSNIIV